MHAVSAHKGQRDRFLTFRVPMRMSCGGLSVMRLRSASSGLLTWSRFCAFTGFFVGNRKKFMKGDFQKGHLNVANTGCRPRCNRDGRRCYWCKTKKTCFLAATYDLYVQPSLVTVPEYCSLV